MTSTQRVAGSVVSLWRYPVKSMQGEEVAATPVTGDGLLGDRAYALIDNADGKVATAKNPRKWPSMFSFRAALARDETPGAPPARITLPDGVTVGSGEPGIHQVLSRAVGRDVKLSGGSDLQAATSEAYWPDLDGLEHRDTVTEFGLPSGTFFDCASIHILTTATLRRLQALYPQGRFGIRRFRPNIVIETANGEDGFVEDAWLGMTLAIGATVRLSITASCGRCVMTTLAQADLPADPGILRTAAQQNRAKVGVYAAVLKGGKISRGDAVSLHHGQP